MNYFISLLKGCCMGAADVVPGVSGGTIAFITGIYERFVNAIKSIDITAARLLFKGRLREFEEHVDGRFLLSVVGGIAISIFSLAKLMTWLLAAYPIAVWSFFFGLIIASAFLVAQDVRRWTVASGTAIIVGTIAAFAITVASPAETPQTWWFVMLSGAIAICAMILPGISGAFILLLMGQYTHIMAAVANLRIGVIAAFATGAVAGIIAFSRLLSLLLRKYRDVTVATLTGFMVGSLNKVWPWKVTTAFYTDSHGALKALTEQNILPTQFSGDSQLTTAVVMAVVGFSLILFMKKLTPNP